MSDACLRCCLVFRLEPASPPVLLAKHDHAGGAEASGDGGLYGDRERNYADAVALVVGGDPPSNGGDESIGGFKYVQSDRHQVVYGADAAGLCIAVVTGLKYPSRTAIQMLSELYPEYAEQFALQAKAATTNALTKPSKALIKRYCKQYDDATKVDKAAALGAKVEGVKVQMQDNIAAMLQNTEQAETLAERSNQLNEQATVFQKKSKDLRKQMRCKNLKMTAILVALVVGILVIVLVPLILRAKRAIEGDGRRLVRGGLGGPRAGRSVPTVLDADGGRERVRGGGL